MNHATSKNHDLFMILLGALAAWSAGAGCSGPEQPAPADHAASARVTLGNIHHIETPDADKTEGEGVDGSVEEGGRIQWEFEGGVQLRLDRFLIVVSDIELHACVDNEEAPASGAWLDLLVPSAHAHVPSSATRLGTPFVEDLLGKPGKASILGEIAPPPMSYCNLYTVIAPADDDVINLTDVPTEALEGKSAMLAGAWRAPTGNGDDEDGLSDWTTFEHTFDFKHLQKIPLIDPKTGTSPLKLEDKGSAFILLDSKLSRALIEDPSELSKPDKARALVARVLQESSIYRPPARNEK